MKTTLLAAASVFAATLLAQQARADVWTADFAGAGISATITVTAVPDVSPTDPNPLCGQPAQNICRSDPASAYMITDITGTFSDSNIGISNAAITGLVPINPTNERDPTFDKLVPTSLSYIDFTNESPPDVTGLSYNNLFFPDGSPIDCDFPFSGTLFDVFGAAFTIAGGDDVVLWGDGNYQFGPLTYGAAVTDGTDRLDYVFSDVSAVPEPGSLSLLAIGLLGLLAWRNRSVILG